MTDINIAILSPSENSYSETFIQAHRHMLDGNIFYYYGGSLPNQLDHFGPLLQGPVSILHKITGKLKKDISYADRLALKKSFKRNKIQVVIAEYGPTGNAVVTICKSMNIPLIVHFHGYDASVRHIATNENYKDLFEYASNIIAVSNVMKQRLIDIGCPDAKLVLNTYGPDESFLNIKPDYTNKAFLALGRLVDKKAPYYTVLAFKKVIEKHSDAQLIIGGDGPLKNTISNLIKYYSLQDNINLAGVLSRQEFQDQLKSSLAFVQHSITAENGDMEGTPVAILEASAAGVPVISTNHAGIPDVILHNETGLLVEEHDVDAMANCMIKILDQPDLAENLGMNGKNRISDKFTLSRHIAQLNEIIQSTKASY